MIPAYHLDENEIHQAIAEWVTAQTPTKIMSIKLEGPKIGLGGPDGTQSVWGGFKAVVMLAGNPQPPKPSTPPKGPEPGSLEAQIAQFDDEMHDEA